MPKRTRPRHGSLQYWPRKRAKRIYPQLRAHGKELKPLGFAAYKAGMTHVQYVDGKAKSPTYGKPIVRPVTILDAPPLFVCALRFYKKTPLGLASAGEHWFDKIPKELMIERKTAPSKSRKDVQADDVRLIVATQPGKSGLRKRKPDLFELPLGGSASAKAEYAVSLLGKELQLRDIFRIGDYVDVSAVTKGHGFTGPVKRFGIRIQTRKDQKMHRHVGSIGGTTPRKVDWRVPAAGQYGFFTRTELSKRIVLIADDPKKITPDGGFLSYGALKSAYTLVEGSVPGHKKRLVMLRKASRIARFEPVELRYISLESKQGV